MRVAAEKTAEHVEHLYVNWFHTGVNGGRIGRSEPDKAMKGYTTGLPLQREFYDRNPS